MYLREDYEKHCYRKHICMRYVDWLLEQPVNITHVYTSCCLYRVDPPDDEQQACSKHVEAYY